MENTSKFEVQEIPKETLEWMDTVGIKRFERPMTHYTGSNQLYSDEYLANTPLEVLKAKYDVRRIEVGIPEMDDGIKW